MFIQTINSDHDDYKYDFKSLVHESQISELPSATNFMLIQFSDSKVFNFIATSMAHRVFEFRMSYHLYYLIDKDFS